MSQATRQNLILLVLVILPLVGIFGYVMFLLHTPNPQHRTPVVLDRSSLLPHRYAGPCMNCHRIQPSTPIAINTQNASRLRLTDRDRILVYAGQRVDRPPVGLGTVTPAITRIDILAHSYVGVCSNCHVVLDIHPSPLFMKKAMLRAQQSLLDGRLTPDEVAHGGAQLDRTRALIRDACGYAALLFLALSSVFMVLRGLPRDESGAPPRWRDWLVVHEWSAVGFALATFAHWYYSDRGNNFLHVALVLIAWLTIEGLLLRARLAKGSAHRNLRMVHTQRVLFFAVAALLVMGHLLSNLA
jgi:hypothetical protein